MGRYVATQEEFDRLYRTGQLKPADHPVAMPPCPKAAWGRRLAQMRTIYDVKLTRKETADLKRENRLWLLVYTLDRKYIASNESKWFWQAFRALRQTRSNEQAFYLAAVALEKSYGYDPDKPAFADMLRKRGFEVK